MKLPKCRLSFLLAQVVILTDGIQAFLSCASSAAAHHPSQSAGRLTDHSQNSGTLLALAEESSKLMEIELTPEPDGGKELSALKTMPACRMKEMATIKDDGFEFWMTAQAEGSLIKQIRTQVLKESAKKANFPGFRKGQVPPFAQPQITAFAVQESLVKTVQGAIQAFGLEALPGSDGKMEVHEDVSEISKAYETGLSIPFTATVCCKYTEEALAKQNEVEGSPIENDAESSS